MATVIESLKRIDFLAGVRLENSYREHVVPGMKEIKGLAKEAEITDIQWVRVVGVWGYNQKKIRQKLCRWEHQ